MKRTVGGGTTRYEYGAGGELIAERNEATGFVTKAYCYKGGELIATTTNGTTYEYAAADNLGSPRAWTNNSGNLVAGGRHDYMPFGEELLAGYGTRAADQGYATGAQQDGQRKQFASKEWDIETGLSYFLARYYSSAQGRFTSVDPENAGAIEDDPQTWNGYAYARNNPTTYGDPNGKEFQLCDLNGNCSNHSDKNVDQWRMQEGVKLIKGKIFDKDGKQIGTFRRLSDDSWDAKSNAIVYGKGGLVDRAPQTAWAIQKVGEIALQIVTFPMGGGLGGRGISLGLKGARVAKGAASTGAESAAQYQLLKASLRRMMEKPPVTDPKLQSIMSKAYREGATVGSGSTADAIRHELATGQPVGGVFHSQKGADLIRGLESWIKAHPNALPSDVHAARQVLLDLKDSLGLGTVIP